jgi:hypothetical protein
MTQIFQNISAIHGISAWNVSSCLSCNEQLQNISKFVYVSVNGDSKRERRDDHIDSYNMRLGSMAHPLVVVARGFWRLFYERYNAKNCLFLKATGHAIMKSKIPKQNFLLAEFGKHSTKLGDKGTVDSRYLNSCLTNSSMFLKYSVDNWFAISLGQYIGLMSCMYTSVF